MPQTHHPERSIWIRKETRAFWALDPAGKCVIFIHGYGGDAIRSWSDFHRLLPTKPNCASTDFIFYGYDGRFANMIPSSALFAEFLDNLFAAPLDVINASLPVAAHRSRTFHYEQLLIVAHSLGAVLSRWALLLAHKDSKSWLPKTKLVLFAPAHMGASLVNLVKETLDGFKWFEKVTTVLSFASPLIEELKPGSSQLTMLNQETTAAINAGASYLKPARVFVAERDRVVVTLPFGLDPPPIAIPDTTHSSICKPKISFMRPLNEIYKLL